MIDGLRNSRNITVRRLWDAVNHAIPLSDLEWPGDDEVSRNVIEALVHELGITKEAIRILRDAAMEWQTYSHPSHPKGDQDLQALADILTTFVNASEIQEADDE